MSTKKKTSKRAAPKKSAAWTAYFAAAMTGTAQAARRAVGAIASDELIAEEAACSVRLAEKMADIAVGRTA